MTYFDIEWRYKMQLTIAHSPDSDDAYMMAPLALKWLHSEEFTFKFVHKDIESLNIEALDCRYDVTAISFGAYPKLINQYDLLTAGSSIQEGTGPLLVSNKPITKSDLYNITIAVPGLNTSAYLTLTKWMPNVKVRVVPFDKIIPALLAGEYQAGLLIHEGQLMYKELALHLVLDLGAWWKEKYDLPLPMGGNAIRKNLPLTTKLRFASLMRRSVELALSRHSDSLTYAQSFGRNMDDEMIGRYVLAWVNQFTIDLGARGKEAVAKLLGVKVNWIN
jgi:1,4-dihydroxy-6-naphthoate synthase